MNIKCYELIIVIHKDIYYKYNFGDHVDSMSGSCFFSLEVWRFGGIILFARGWDVGQSSILGKFTVSF